ncbi:hypothetical protein [Flavobacterium sp. LM4]|uniref:hypothetical protein n=1 Tax=Flavobacterium sp. LM4 TaxID=1938609 RepID=UPI0009919158|nr:hypothetical protein [Flavobacterium sp. LM4]OOV20092.1 hypothetical protein BXU10_10850 [Flavobacterium sp. LM4]
MSYNKLNIIPVLEKGQTYNASTGTLILNNEGSIFVTIKQYQEDEKKIKELEKKKKSSLEFARQKWEQHAKEGWSKRKLDENYEANMQDWEKLNKESQALIEKYENINWCWQLVGNKLDHNTLSHNQSFSKGISQIQSLGKQKVAFPALLVGGGMAWLEAFHEKEGAMGKIPNGVYVKAKGTPKILRTEWTDFSYQPIVETIGFMSKVILHIYTSGMYGQEVEIKLIDRDLFTGNDELNFSGQSIFVREVNVLKVKKNDIGKVGVSDLLKSKENTADNIQYTQKIEVEVLVEAIWEKEGGKELKIFPIIKSIQDDIYFENFERSYLSIAKNGLILTAPNEVSNKVAVVGAVETNESAFHPCQYTEITLEYEKDHKTEVLEIFKETPGVSYNSNIEIGLILGSDPKILKVKTDKNSNTDECRYTDDRNHGNQIHIDNKNDLTNFKQTELINRQLSFESWFEYDRNDMSKYFWLSNTFSKNSFNKLIKVNVQSCRHQKYINLHVLPDIEWELAFLISTGAGFRVKADKSILTRAQQSLGDYQAKGIKVEQLGKIIEKGGIGYSLVVKYSINGGAYVEQVSLEFVKNIEKIIGTYNLIFKWISIFNTGEAPLSAAIKTGNLDKITFDIDPPSVVFFLKWKYDYAKKNKQAVINFTGGAGFKPLIGIKIGVDLVANASKFGGLVGLIIEFLAKTIKTIAKVDLYIIAEVGSSIAYDESLSYNEIDGFDPAMKTKITVDINFSFKAGIKRKDIVFIANTQRIVDNTIPVNEAEQEALKIEGAISTGVQYTKEKGYDLGKGDYSKTKIIWLGAEMTITVVTLNTNRKMNAPPNDQFKKKFNVLNRETLSDNGKEYTKHEG